MMVQEGLKAVHDKQKQQVDKINNDVKLREKLVELLRIISEVSSDTVMMMVVLRWSLISWIKCFTHITHSVMKAII